VNTLYFTLAPGGGGARPLLILVIDPNIGSRLGGGRDFW